MKHNLSFHIYIYIFLFNRRGSGKLSTREHPTETSMALGEGVAAHAQAYTQQQKTRATTIIHNSDFNFFFLGCLSVHFFGENFTNYLEE